MDSDRSQLPVWLRGFDLDSLIERRAMIMACETTAKEPERAHATFTRLMLKAPDLNAAEELWYAALSMLYVSNFAAEMIASVAGTAGVLCSARRVCVAWDGGSFDVQDLMHRDAWPMRFVAKLLLELFHCSGHGAALEMRAPAFVLVEDNNG